MWKNHKPLLFMVGISLVLGGCQIAKEKKTSKMQELDLPDVRALQDEFTRGFIESTEEVEKGYYSFLSGTKRYRMLFPKEGVIHQGYGIRDDQFEGFLMSTLNDNGTDSQIKINYYTNESTENAPVVLEILEGRVDQKLEFEKITSESSEVYYAPIEFEPDVFGIAALVVSLNGEGSVQIVYDTQCKNDKNECQQIKEEEIEKMIHWARSFEFVDQEVQ
ncbi:hypothetical protein [Psychrobacillus lasiicapitis]|uniref:Uncharacterized protein n=1 Tax=Psychrobacillus lasiicapitis TaxID=1636719 RepID=A0A544T1S9_9BACI|nr:hypothetical protein [Psychrobacillus lasiicapitis]TQR11397.1 hypothetical protein FG382_15745 [Psychrobacillus lasiicapitis]GGA40888.1 hypothetical protein GCM10011384_33190 [Psychrobacillus lasiicapitis]